MRTLLYGLAGLIVIVIGIALLVPQFLDFNQYKPEIAAQVKAATGRDLTIDGDISLTVLPSLALVVADVRLANAPGGVAENMARVREAQVDVALLPLLRGRYEVKRVRLVDPEIALEVLPDGRANWEFAAPAEPEPPAATAGEASDARPAGEASDGSPTESSGEPGGPTQPPADGRGDAPLAVSVENFEIENGTIIYRDLPAGTDERIDALDASIRLASLDGPVESRGNLTVRGIATSFDFSLGNIRERTLVPVRLRLFDAEGSFKSELRGHVSDLPDTPRIQGDLDAEGDILASVIQSVAPQDLPGFLAQPFSLAGKIDASPSGARIETLTVKLGETSASGSLSATVEDGLALTTQLSVGTIDLDTWLSMPTVRAAGGSAAAADAPPTNGRDTGTEAGTGAGTGNGTAAGGTDGAGGAAVANDVAPWLPPDLTAELTVSVEAIAFRGKPLHQVQAAATLAQGEVTISQLSALLPGGADAALFGFVAADDGEPRFEGQLDARATDLAGLLAWLGMEVQGTPVGRLRSLTAKAVLTATANRIETRNLDIQVDRSRITGGLAAALGETTRIDADLKVDRVNLDDLLAAATTDGAATDQARSPASRATSPQAGTPSPRTAVTVPAAGTAEAGPLDTLQADVKLSVGAATWRGAPVEDIRFDGTLQDGDLTIREARVGNLARASAQVSGVVLDPTNALRLRDLTVDASVPEPERLARLFEATLPPEVLALGALSGHGVINGAPSAPTVDLTVEAAGTRLRANGAADLTAEGTADMTFDGTLGIVSDNIGRLIAAVSQDYRPAGPLGATDINASVKNLPGRLELCDIKGTLGGVTLGGTLSLDHGDERPTLRADLVAGTLVIDRFLPAKQSAALPRWIVPVAWTPTPARTADRSSSLLPAAVSTRWSQEPIDVSALRDFDADIRLRADSLQYDRATLANADITAALAGGVLTLPSITGTLFGGAFQADANLDARATPTFSLTVAADNVNLAQAAAGAGGRATVNSALQGGGASEAEIIASLNGDGTLTVRGLDVQSDPTAMPILGPVLGVIVGPAKLLDRSLGGIFGALGGGDAADTGIAGASGSFVVRDGVLRSDDIAFNTPAYSAGAAGVVDLPQWVMDVSGTIRLSQNVTGTLLRGVNELPTEIPFRASGPPDNPKVDIDLSAITSVTIPGLDQLRKASPEAGKILDQILPGLGGGGGATESGAAGAGEAPDGGETKKPEKILEDTLRGLFR